MSNDHREAIAEVLTVHLEPWWRCVHEHRLGPTMDLACRSCERECVEVGEYLTDALLGSDASRTSQKVDILGGRPVLAQIRAEARAEAWDEGYEAFARQFVAPVRDDGTRAVAANPYRAEGSA